MRDARVTSGRAALESAGARVLWLGCAMGGVGAALELAPVGRGRPVAATLVGVLAAAALGVVIAGLAALPAAGLSALARREPLAGWIARSRLLLAMLAGCALAWLLTDPFLRRLAPVYVALCLGTGAALATAVWLARRRAAAPEVLAAAILALAGLASALAISRETYEELQDLGSLVAVAGALSATTSLLARLERWRGAPILAGAALLAALGALWALDLVSPHWRAVIYRESRGASRGARGLRAVVDLDRDGYSPIFDGGDCDDLDAAIHPLAVDLPGGGDQNCNGVDAPISLTAAERGLAPAAGEPSLSEGAAGLVLLITVDCWRADALDPDLMPEVSAFARGGLAFERLYAAGSSTRKALPMVVGVGPRGPWVGEIATGAGIQADAVIAGGIPASLWGFRATRTEASSAEEVTDAALESVDAAGQARHLLWVHYFDLHDLAQYRGDRPVPARPVHLPASYRVGARHVDRAIGRLLAGLERRGLLARSVVLITGDHGEGLGAHGVSNHGRTGYEEVLRVPGILRGPGIPAASVQSLVSHRDVPATLLGSLGLGAQAEAAEHFGRSWLRLRDDPARPLHRFAIARSARWVSGRESKSVLGVLVEGHHKLVAGLEDGQFELYDLASDPGEAHDLAAREVALRQRLWRQLALAWDLDYQHPSGD